MYKKYLHCLVVYLKGPLEKGYDSAREHVYSIRESLGIDTKIYGKHPFLVYNEMRELPIEFFGGIPVLVKALSDIRRPGILLLESRKRDFIYQPHNIDSLLPGKRFLKGMAEPCPATNNGKKLYRPIEKSWVLKHPNVLTDHLFYLIKSK